MLLIAVGLPTLVLIAVLPRLSWRWRAARTGVRALARLSGTPLTVSGAENLPPHGSAVIVANHPSYLDSLVLVAALSRPRCLCRRPGLRAAAGQRSDPPPARRRVRGTHRPSARGNRHPAPDRHRPDRPLPRLLPGRGAIASTGPTALPPRRLHDRGRRRCASGARPHSWRPIRAPSRAQVRASRCRRSRKWAGRSWRQASTGLPR